jgi:hypothetical protein
MTNLRSHLGLAVAVFLAEACFGAAGDPLEIHLCRSAEHFFGGGTGSISIAVSNRTTNAFEPEISAKLFQLNSATGAPMGIYSIGAFRLEPGRTVERTFSFPVPEVAASTSFLMQWTMPSGGILGRHRLHVHPTNMLAQFARELGPVSLDLAEQDEVLGASFRGAAISVRPVAPAAGTPMSETTLLVAVDPPFAPDANAALVVRAFEAGAGVVWLRRPETVSNRVSPTLCVLPGANRALVVLCADWAVDFPLGPQAQFELTEACRLALRPTIPDLPDLVALRPPGKRHEP